MLKVAKPAVLRGETLRQELEAAGFSGVSVTLVGDTLEIDGMRGKVAIGTSHQPAISAVLAAHSGGPTAEQQALLARITKRQRAAALFGRGFDELTKVERLEASALLGEILADE